MVTGPDGVKRGVKIDGAKTVFCWEQSKTVFFNTTFGKKF
jgi:hypothetical protein